MRSPACSIMALMAPVRLRAVASGLRIEKVRSTAIGFYPSLRLIGEFNDIHLNVMTAAAYTGSGYLQQVEGSIA
jgi:hypothetical protein